MKTRATTVAIAAFVALGIATDVPAAGPMFVNGGGAPLVWAGGAVSYNPDRGSLGVLSNAEATALVDDAFAVWQAVPSAAFTVTNAGQLPNDVTRVNYASTLGQCGDGKSPVVFDTDGSITEDLIGIGGSDSVLGFAALECGTYVPPLITEGLAVLNGKWIDGVPGTEVTLEEFRAVFIHEFGHYLGLDHSQVNLTEAFDDDASNDEAIATMFPILVNGVAAATLALDDRVSVSMLYPGPGFASGFGTIRGTLLQSDGTTPVQGAYVVARKTDDPRITAVGVPSGARYFPFFPGGPTPPELQGLFELPGLPAGSYTLEVERILPEFNGGSAIGPFNFPIRLPGPPEFWNGANEAATDPPDDPTASTPIVVTAGATQTGLDIVFNEFTPPANDACIDATDVAALPFRAVLETRGATSEGADPLQACTVGGASQNTNSVWFRFTAPTDMELQASTIGSEFLTVVSAWSGSCGGLGALACSDGLSTEGRLVVPLAAGETALLEVTKAHAPEAAELHFALRERTVVPEAIVDPTGDTFGAAATPPDLTGLSAHVVGDELLLVMEFTGPVLPGTTSEPNAVRGFAYFDVDRDPLSGGVSLIDTTEWTTGLGVDAVVTLPSLLNPVPHVISTSSGNVLGVGRARFDGNVIVVTVPVAALATDGIVDVAAIVGGPSGPSDFAPNVGAIQSVAGCPNGTPCDDGSVCTTNDACAGGSCIGTPVSCDDGNPCTDDVCREFDGVCEHPFAAGAPCDDGNPCTTEICSLGACRASPVLCIDLNPCTLDLCNPATGTCVFVKDDSLPCTDGSACTTDDRCHDGTCTGTPVGDCDDTDPCTVDTCDPSSGACLHVPASGSSCDDGVPCTASDVCSLGTCTPGHAVGPADVIALLPDPTGVCGDVRAPLRRKLVARVRTARHALERLPQVPATRRGKLVAKARGALSSLASLLARLEAKLPDPCRSSLNDGGASATARLGCL